MIKLFKKAAILSMSALLLLPSFTLAADTRYSDGYSKYAIVADYDTGRIIYAKDPEKKSAMASMSKIMTLLLAFDAIKAKKASPNDIITIQEGDVSREGTNIKLVPGEKITLDELMKGMMIVSANDAALAISRHIAGDYKKFIDQMNSKAKEIGMKDTVFYNPNGLPYEISKDGVSTENTTTANDVLKLSKWMYQYYPKETVAITSQKKYVDKKKGIDEESTNPLLPILPNVDGIKTGYTTKAGYCLAYSMKIPKGNGNESTNRLLGVTMGSGSKEARKDAAYSALTFIDKHYKTKFEYRKDQKVLSANLNGKDKLNSDLIAKDNIKVVKRDNEKFDHKVSYNKLSIRDINKKPAAKVTLLDKNKNKVTEFPVFVDTANMKGFSKFKLWISALGASIKSPDSKGNYPIFTL